MADEAEVDAQVASLKQLLDQSNLPAEDAVDFGASDLRLLVRKGYYKERQLQTATRDDLQGPPGDAVKPALIRVLLTAFNPSALQQGGPPAERVIDTFQAALKVLPSPSRLAKGPTLFLEEFEGCPFLIGLPMGREGLPAAFVEPFFAAFLDDARSLEPDAAASEALMDLMKAMNNSYVDTTTETHKTMRERVGAGEGTSRSGEDGRMVYVRKILLKLFAEMGISVGTLEPVLTSKGSTEKTDGGVSIFQGNVLILHCTLIEGKESMGSGNGWSYVQLGGYYANMIQDSYHEHFVRNSSVPVLGLEVVGNVFRVVTLYFTEGVCMEPLTSYLHLHDVRAGQPQYSMEVMRALQAFVRAVHCLQTFYDKLLQAPSSNKDRSEFQLPYMMRGRYAKAEPMPCGRHIWEVTISSGEQRAVKVASGSYDELLHQEMAQCKVAPELLAYERYAGDVYLLETEYLPESGGWMRLDRAAESIQDWPGATAKLDAAADALHACCGSKAVHGDLRAPNIMVRLMEGAVAEVRLLDLEQAGRAGTARYGYFLNDKVAWPLQKPDGQLITQQHDRALLHTTLADCRSAGVRQPSTPAQASMRPSMCPSTPRARAPARRLAASRCLLLANTARVQHPLGLKYVM